jgi:tetratricopeptide (TPR) repeat protein
MRFPSLGIFLPSAQIGGWLLVAPAVWLGVAFPCRAEQPVAKPLTAKQHARLKERDRLAAEAEKLRQEGRLPEMVAAWNKKLAIEREVYGNVHAVVADSLAYLAQIHELDDNFKGSGKAWQEVVVIQRKLHGGKDWRVTNAKLDLKDMKVMAGLSPEDRQRLKQATIILSRKVTSLYQGGQFKAALPVAQRVVNTYRQLLGKENRKIATGLNDLALLYYAMGDYPKALAHYEKVRDLTKKLLTENHPDYAQNLNNLAALYRAMGDYPKALPLLEKARDLIEKLLTENHPNYAASLNNLARLYRDMGDYPKALPLCEKARDLYKKLLRENHPDYATILHNLALLYQDMGDYKKALPLYKKVRDLINKLLTENHPHYAAGLNNLAGLYREMGDYQKALPLLEKARDLYKKLLTENHPHYAGSLHSLALLYKDMGDYQKALHLCEEAHELDKKLLTENHPNYATSLNNLAGLYQDMGDYPKALPLYEKARDLDKKLLTENHPSYATSLHNLAMLYQDMGNYQKALLLLEKARNIRRKLLTENHPLYATSLNNLAGLLYCLKKPKEAAPLVERGLNIDKAFLDNTFTAQSYRQRLDFLHQLKGSLDLFLTVGPQADVQCARLYDQVLAWKGALALRQAEEHLAHDHPDLQSLLDDLRRVRAGLAHLARKPAATASQQADWLKRFASVERAKEKLETRLAQKSEVFRRAFKLREASSQEIQKVLQAGTALVDFVLYTHFTPPPKGKGHFVREERLLAFVITPHRQPVLIKLGPVKVIDQAVQDWRKAMAQYKPLYQKGKQLARLLWWPLRPHMGNAKTVLLSPDGPVCGLPFASLPGKRARSYLVEDLAIGYVTSGRQLLELACPKGQQRGRGLLTVGGLPYGKPSASGPLAAVSWPELPGTRLESQRVARIFTKAFPQAEAPRQFRGEAVDAAALKKELPPAAKARPGFLHLATHGYFEAPAPYRSERRTFGMLRDYLTYDRNPLVRSGLVLAGANNSPGEGILTAEEVAGLDLRGVELAVLSACDTALGKQVAGEGVLGLQRAFQAAGARALVISLWSVNDAATSVLMEEFYTNLWTKKMSKLKALQQAQRTVLRHPSLVAKRARKLRQLLAKRGVSKAVLAARGIGPKSGKLPKDGMVQQRSHPALWAAFVLSGDGK